MEIVFPLKFSYFLSKRRGKLEFFMIAKEISKSNFFGIFSKRQEKMTPWSRNRRYWLTSKRGIMYLPETALKVFLSETFFFTCRELPFCFRPAPFVCGRTVFQTKQTYKGMKIWQFSEAAVRRCSFKYFSQKFFKIHRKTHVPVPLF